MDFYKEFIHPLWYSYFGSMKDVFSWTLNWANSKQLFDRLFDGP